MNMVIIKIRKFAAVEKFDFKHQSCFISLNKSVIFLEYFDL